MGRWGTAWRWLQTLGGVAVLAALLWTLGTGPFLDGIRAVDGRTLAVAAAIIFMTTLCSAWRWRLVSGGLGQEIPFRAAVASYYRSQFLNSVLPGGVLGDVHRGVVQGRTAGGVGRGLRAVVWERAAGQVLQLALAVAVLALLPSPIHRVGGVLAVILIVVGAAALVLVQLRSVAGSQWWVRVLRVSAADIRRGLLNRRTAPGVFLASTGAVAGYTAVFLIAARASGVEATVLELLPLAVFVLLAMSIPANIAGWGPREGAAAWAFSAAGLGAAQGVSAAVVYGVLSFAACLPGAAVLVVDRARRRGATAVVTAPAPAQRGSEGGTHG
ncbi:lysylphosphatidylglycerol synthase transmembrane domain-containing protein [Arthrobacter sp.]|uniref:lysylphosphatidylglycerol synthase transmembrane domain-containing protein n=1 Tax=Arthrobacter sp. TaxID=1667 RepID=UPI0026DFA8CF|nr:lysylphosphatidylglycerol synthase transmembrane domain-containing protein [Arthrobacter sp.]MDO5753518.1 lysylphosphatidylglycerol synthase transmembrane domain-containing protein [Arthrobacter sp.]